MSHLSIEQLVALREPGVEPGGQAAREHLEHCAHCRDELDRLHQRVARLKALPSLRATRDRWPAVRARLEAERRARYLRRVRLGGLVGLAAAASLALALHTRPRPAGPLAAPEPAAATEISQAMARSRALEQAITRLDPDARVLDGRTARVAQELEDRIAAVDRQLEMNNLLGEEQAREAQQLRLWRERVGLLDALVDVHLTRASKVGL
ncbi:MAG TPA: hypothetical protein VFK09_09625 [Gemmatimonadales bacterium]|nr:hypothetical protein [Gemmatimonadales bacterium]